jgi:hypothetical protein
VIWILLNNSCEGGEQVSWRSNVQTQMMAGLEFVYL